MSIFQQQNIYRAVINDVCKPRW